MKQFLFVVALISMFIVSGIQIALADMLPEGAKSVTTCAKLTGISTLPNFVVYARESGPVMETPKVWQPREGDCVDVGYKFNSIDIYAVDAERAKTLAENYDPANDSNAYKANMQIDVSNQLVDKNSQLTFQHNLYKISGVDVQNHKLVLVAQGFVTNLSDVTAPAFTDVPKSSPYYEALTYLKNTNVVAGYPDGSFKPNNRINRAEFTLIIVNAISGYPFHYDLCMEGYANEDGSYQDLFTDVLAKDDVWYMNAVCYAKSDHLISGYPDGSFKPDRKINYAEAATILAHGFRVTVPKAHSGDVWYKSYVDALETLKVVPSTIKSASQNITRGEMAQMIYALQQ